MPPSRRASRELITVAARGLDPVALRDSLIGPLQRLMNVGPVFIAAADPATWLLTGGSNAEVSPEATKRFLANEYGQADLVKFTDVAAAREPAQSLYAAAGKDPAASARWREVLEPLGWGDELRIALRDRSGVWGFLCLHRSGDDPAFDKDDIAAITAVIPHLTESFRRTATVAGSRSHAASAPGVMLLDSDLRLTATTGCADALLDELGVASPGYALPMPVVSLASRLLRERSPQRLTMQTSGGRWVSLHAALLEGAGLTQVAVVAETPGPAEVMPVFATAIGLTPREAEVAAALLRGQSNRLTARGLQVTEQTLQTQIRSIFAKAGVHSRSELIARLIGGH